MVLVSGVYNQGIVMTNSLSIHHSIQIEPMGTHVHLIPIADLEVYVTNLTMVFMGHV